MCLHLVLVLSNCIVRTFSVVVYFFGLPLRMIISINLFCNVFGSRYKSRKYRSLTVRDPRKVLKLFGTEINDDVAIHVHDSTADTRYMVLPQRPIGTTGWDEHQLKQIVTRDSLIGVTRCINILASSDFYEGEFKDGNMHGRGKEIYANGDIYEGEYKDGKKHGRSKYTWANGDFYEGGYKDGDMHGLGKYTWADGDFYEGEYNVGEMHGQGIIKDKHGRVLQEGTWENGTFRG